MLTFRYNLPFYQKILYFTLYVTGVKIFGPEIVPEGVNRLHLFKDYDHRNLGFQDNILIRSN